MNLVIGLGNPGSKYQNNRHNIGFMILDEFAKKKRKTYKHTELYDYFVFRRDLYVKPNTYMNRSGLVLRDIAKKNNIEDILVIVDDIYLELGNIRLREKGGDGGHNGLKSIISCLGNSNFKRLRIGVGSPENQNLADFVLDNFSENDMKIITKTIGFSNELIEIFMQTSYRDALNFFSRNKRSYSESISESNDQRRN